MYSRMRHRYQDVLLLGRQLSHLVRKSGSVETAMADLRGMVNEKQKALFSRFERVYTEKIGAPQISIGPYATLFRLSDSIKAEGGDYLGVFAQFDRMLSDIDEHARNLWKSMAAFFIYVFAVSAIAMVVSFIVMIFVLPQFEDMFHELGAELPALTAFLIKDGGSLLQVILLVFAAFVGILFYAIVQILNASANLSACGRYVKFIPLFRSIAESLQHYLSMNFSLILINAGVATTRALNLSSEIAGDPNIGSLAKAQTNSGGSQAASIQALALALKADNLPAELEYQINQQKFRLAEQMQSARVSIMLFIYILLANIIGTLVIALYLPIFKLGAVS